MPSVLRRCRAVLAGIVACALASGLSSPIAAQPAAAIDTVPLAQDASIGGDEVPVSFRCHLQTDNNLVLRAGRLDAHGDRTPSRVKVVIARAGQILASVRTDEWGAAQVIGLKPAVYSVLTAGKDGFAAFTVSVLAFEPPQPEDRSKPSPPQRRAGLDAVEIHLAPNSEYSFLKTLMQHKGHFLLLAVKEGDVVSSIEPRPTGRYSLAGISTGCYSVLGGGVMRKARLFYASCVYHVERDGRGGAGKGGTSQLLPAGRRPAGARFVADEDDDDEQFETSPCPFCDYPILESMLDEVNASLAGPAPAAAPAAPAPAAGGAGAGGGLGGLLGAAGAGLGVGGLSGGGGLGGGGGVPRLASDFVPAAPQ